MAAEFVGDIREELRVVLRRPAGQDDRFRLNVAEAIGEEVRSTAQGAIGVATYSYAVPSMI